MWVWVRLGSEKLRNGWACSLLAVALSAAGGCGRTALESGETDAIGGVSAASGGAFSQGGVRALGGRNALGGNFTSGGVLSAGGVTGGMGAGGVAGSNSGATGNGAGTAGANPSRGGNAAGGSAGIGGANANRGGSAGTAGAGGEAGRCDAIVADGSPIQPAIDRVTPPATVCVESGRHLGNLALRDGVDVRGSGSLAIVCGSIAADAATLRGATLSGLKVVGQINASSAVHLDLENLEIRPNSSRDCPTRLSGAAVHLAHQGAGSVRFHAEQVAVDSPGFEIWLIPAREILDAEITITRSRCDDPFQCYDFLYFRVDSQPGEMLVEGSRLSLEISNNLVQNMMLEGLAFALVPQLSAPDAAASALMVRHNTLISKGDPNYGITFWDPPAMPIVLANNAVAYVATPVRGGTPPVTQLSSLLSSDASSKAWFVDFDGGNFVPAAGSPLIGAGDETYGLGIDIDGHPRNGHFDIGAYQR